MTSPAALQVRTAILLLGLIVVPVVAVVGTQGPPQPPVNAAPRRPSTANNERNSLVSRGLADLMAREPEAASSAPQADSTNSAGSPIEPAEPSQRVVATPRDPVAPPSAVPVIRSLAAPPAWSPPPPAPAAEQPPASRGQNPSGASLVVDAAVRPAAAFVPVVHRPSETLPPDDGTAAPRFEQLQQRLRQLGADYYVLETYGEAHDRYRFRCRAALDDQPGFARSFEAVDPDAMQAIRLVMHEVEQWRRQLR